MKSRSASKIKLTSYDDLIGGAVSKDDIQEIPIGQLRDFVNHPFHVNDDDEMNELVESIKTQGIENKSTIEYGTEQGLAALIYGEQGVSSLPIQDIRGEYIDTDNEYMYYYSVEFIK